MIQTDNNVSTNDAFKGAHVLTDSDRKKGGKANLGKRKIPDMCGMKCPVFPCPLVTYSKQDLDGKCAAKELPIETSRGLFELMSNDKDKRIAHLLRTVADLFVLAKGKGDLKSIAKYLTVTIQAYKFIDGISINQEVKKTVAADIRISAMIMKKNMDKNEGLTEVIYNNPIEIKKLIRKRKKLIA